MTLLNTFRWSASLSRPSVLALIYCWRIYMRILTLSFHPFCRQDCRFMNDEFDTSYATRLELTQLARKTRQDECTTRRSSVNVQVSLIVNPLFGHLISPRSGRLSSGMNERYRKELYSSPNRSLWHHLTKLCCQCEQASKKAIAVTVAGVPIMCTSAEYTAVA